MLQYIILCLIAGAYQLDSSAPPSLPEIHTLVLTEAAAKWSDLATMLHVDHRVVKIIEMDCHYKVEASCMQMLTRWLKCDPYTGNLPRTWDTLLSALSAIGKTQFVENLKAQYFRSHH